MRFRSERSHRGCQPAGPMAPRETGLMCANMLRAFQVGKALTSDGGPSSWMRPSTVAWEQESWPACALRKDSASAVTQRSPPRQGSVLQISEEQTLLRNQKQQR